MAAPELDVFRCELAGTQLVEASAGTGKTWNLCALVLRLLLERGLALPQILVVTFTNAATAELRERIRGRIAETLDALRGRGPAAAAATGTGGDRFVPELLATLRAQGHEDATLARRLDEALQCFDEAAIHTIHGLCQRALADNAFSAGVPLAQELLADDGELRLQAVQDFWRRHVASPSVDASAGASTGDPGGETGRDALPPDLAAHLLKRGDSPEAWAELLRRRLAQPTARALWPDAIDTPLDDGAALALAFAQAQALWAGEREAIVGRVLDALPRLNAGVYKAERVARAAESWNALLTGGDALAAADDKLLRLLCTATLQGKTKKNQAPPAPHAFFDLADELLVQREARAQALALARLRLLRALLDEAPEALRQAKRSRRVLAFDDLLQQLHARLHGDGGARLAAALRARYPAALIDEFQDTDPLQFAIFQRIYDGTEAPLVLLGDPKQAIYSFRGADLHTYLTARRTARAEATLAENQRSSAPLIAALNALFGRQPRAFLQPGLSYHPVRRGAKPLPPLEDRSTGAEPRAPLQLWRLPPGDDGRPFAKRAARHAAALATAGEIARLLAAAQRGELQLGGRPVGAGDIAVLVRSHAQGSEMRRALAALGVGCVELSQASVFRSAEAEDLDRVLAAVLEPAREPLLRAALASELMGLDAAALDALDADEAGWLARLAAFADDRQAWLTRGIAAMLRRWRVRERVAERLLARPDGERRLTNLLHLADLLQQAAVDHAGPEALHRWLQARRKESRADEGAQLRLESDRHLVQIVTIHRSKGLEYPFVFCPFLWDGRAGGGGGRQSDGLAWHDDAGRQMLDFASALAGAPDAAAVKARMDQEAAAEQLRLAYVALTRAVHRCTVVVGRYRVGSSEKEAGRGPLAWLVAGSEDAAAGWPTQPLDSSQVDTAWSDFAAAHAGPVRLDPLPTAAATALPRPAPDTDALAALAPPARLPAPWWTASYSALMASMGSGAGSGAGPDTRADAATEHTAADRDRGLADRADTADAADTASAFAQPALARTLPPDDILRFPRGPLAGECLHAVFEHADFADPASWPAAIAAALQARPQPVSPAAELADLADLADPADPAAPARQPAMLQRLLADVLATPLPVPGAAAAVEPIVLARVPAARRKTELEFTLPVARLAAADLTQALQSLGWPAPGLDFGALRGFLRGFIDLVFEHGGRYFLLDWKSNHLGATPAHYAAATVAQAVHSHGYHLQALLYLLALHRWLRHRLPDYDAGRHLGGALVLFVRGVRPGWIDADGCPTGVWAARPAVAVIEALSARLDRDGA
jgi:exodeoxyribonuclease V beta subunit